MKKKFIATDGKFRTQQDWIPFFNNLGVPMLSSADLLNAPKEDLDGLRKDMKDRWLTTSSQIDYSKNTITHYVGSKWSKTIQLKSIPVCRPIYLNELLSNKDGLNYVRALLDNQKAKKDEIIAIFEALSGKSAEQIRFWTPSESDRKERPVRSVDFDYYIFVDGFNVDGDIWFDYDLGLSRGVSVVKKNLVECKKIIKKDKVDSYCGAKRPARKVFCQLKKGHKGSHRAVIFWE